MATSPTFNQRLQAARKNAGLTQTDVVFELRQRLPEPMWVGQTKLHRLETEVAESKADPFLVNVLASVYGVTTTDLSPMAANHLDTLRDLLKQASRCITAKA